MSDVDLSNVEKDLSNILADKIHKEGLKHCECGECNDDGLRCDRALRASYEAGKRVMGLLYEFLAP